MKNNISKAQWTAWKSGKVNQCPTVSSIFYWVVLIPFPNIRCSFKQLLYKTSLALFPSDFQKNTPQVCSQQNIPCVFFSKDILSYDSFQENVTWHTTQSPKKPEIFISCHCIQTIECHFLGPQNLSLHFFPRLFLLLCLLLSNLHTLQTLENKSCNNLMTFSTWS